MEKPRWEPPAISRGQVWLILFYITPILSPGASLQEGLHLIPAPGLTWGAILGRRKDPQNNKEESKVIISFTNTLGYSCQSNGVKTYCIIGTTGAILCTAGITWLYTMINIYIYIQILTMSSSYLLFQVPSGGWQEEEEQDMKERRLLEWHEGVPMIWGGWT